METHGWTQEQAEKAAIPTFAKKFVFEPLLLELIGDASGKQILELGSGSGYWLNLLSDRGANCTGVEISENQIELARKSNPGNIKYIQGDITTLQNLELPKDSYDVIFLIYVLLEMPDKTKLESIVKNSYSFLKKGGELIIIDQHPFAPSNRPYNLKVPENYTYFSSGTVIEGVSTRIDGEKILYHDVHWTLEDLTGLITESGLCITKVAEPRVSVDLANKYPSLVNRLDFPMDILIKSTKH